MKTSFTGRFLGAGRQPVCRVLLFVQDPKPVSMLGQNIIVDDPQFHIPEVHPDLGDFEDGGVIGFDHPGFDEIKQRIVHFIIKDTYSPPPCLHDLFIQGQTEHSDKTVFDLFSFMGGTVGEEIKDRCIHQRILFWQGHDTHGVEGVKNIYLFRMLCRKNLFIFIRRFHAYGPADTESWMQGRETGECRPARSGARKVQRALSSGFLFFLPESVFLCTLRFPTKFTKSGQEQMGGRISSKILKMIQNS